MAEWLVATFRRPVIRLTVVAGCVLVATNLWVIGVTHGRVFHDPATLQERYTIIVPGAAVHGDLLSDVLEDRMETALAVYRAGRGHRFLLSGDHGRPAYDEVNAMRRWLQRRNVPDADIFLDHAGFRTLDTMVRAHEVFAVTGAVVVTQDFHIARALYLADAAGLDAVGIVADRRPYIYAVQYAVREALARAVCWFDARGLLRQPRYLGAVLPITGNSALTRDATAQDGLH